MPTDPRAACPSTRSPTGAPSGAARAPAALLAFAVACGAGKGAALEAGPDDSGGADGGGDGGGEPGGPRDLDPAAGPCPDLSESGLIELQIDGVPRRVTAVIPEGGTEGAPLVYFLHGLVDSSFSDVTGDMVRGLQLQRVANDDGVIFLLPESTTLDLFGFEIYLWDLALETDNDLLLFDTLRTCAAEQLGFDLERMTAWGFSGGALGTTVLAAQRGDALAAIVESSGGSDIEAPIWTEPGAAYSAPGHLLPALLQSGGERDVWPDPSFVIVDFEAASDHLAGQLSADGNPVLRCRHSEGHTLTQEGYEQALRFLKEATYDSVGPSAAALSGDDADWCALQ